MSSYCILWIPYFLRALCREFRDLGDLANITGLDSWWIYPCGKFGDCSFSRFGFTVDRHTDVDERFTRATLVSISKNMGWMLLKRKITNWHSKTWKKQFSQLLENPCNRSANAQRNYKSLFPKEQIHCSCSVHAQIHNRLLTWQRSCNISGYMIK